MTITRQVLKRATHRLQLQSFALELVSARQCESLYVSARTASVLPERQQLADLLDLEP
jgi:hypothetical protein